MVAVEQNMNEISDTLASPWTPSCSDDWSGAKEMPSAGRMTLPNAMIWSTLVLNTGAAMHGQHARHRAVFVESAPGRTDSLVG